MPGKSRVFTLELAGTGLKVEVWFDSPGNQFMPEVKPCLIISTNLRQGTPRWGPTPGKIGLTADFPLHPRTGPLCGAQAGGVLAKFLAALLGSRVTQLG